MFLTLWAQFWEKYHNIPIGTVYLEKSDLMRSSTQVEMSFFKHSPLKKSKLLFFAWYLLLNVSQYFIEVRVMNHTLNSSESRCAAPTMKATLGRCLCVCVGVYGAFDSGPNDV